MKVRSIEQDIYNFIQKNDLIPGTRVGAKFGKGEYYLESLYIENAITAPGLSSELYDALDNLRKNFSIYEIAVCPVFYEVVNGGLPELKDYIPTVRFTRPKYRYGYQGPTWLPAFYFSEKGVRNLFKIIARDVNNIPKKDMGKFYSVFDRQLAGSESDKYYLAAYVSDLAAGELSGGFIEHSKLLKKQIKKLGRDRNPRVVLDRSAGLGLKVSTPSRS